MSAIQFVPGRTVNNWTLNDSSTVVQGWVSGPNSRGTMDIIWGPFLTIFLCSWTVICLNIPANDDTSWTVLGRRAKWMLLAIVGPEVVLSVAIGQFASARRSVKRFHNLGHKHWTLRHGFFADMGGFILQTKDDHLSYPANSRQLAYLVEKGYLECPRIAEKEIWDKSKANAITKLLTILQASCMLVSLLGRCILQLSTTTLELSAGAIVFCTFGTFICWFHKPSDVNHGMILQTEASTAQILREAGELAAEPYRHTPLDFVAKQSFTIGYEVMGFFGRRCDDPRRPLVRFPNDRFPDIGTLEKVMLFCMTTAYAALHLIAWDFRFPTQAESLLWRTSSFVMIGTVVFFWVFETIMARQRFGRWDKYWAMLGIKKKNKSAVSEPDGACNGEFILKGNIRQNTLECMDAFEAEQRESKPLPAIEILLILPVVLSYVAARAYLIVEPLASLRELPLETFATFELMTVLPHW